jgi:hypothetical protein
LPKVVDETVTALAVPWQIDVAEVEKLVTDGLAPNVCVPLAFAEPLLLLLVITSADVIAETARVCPATADAVPSAVIQK